MRDEGKELVSQVDFAELMAMVSSPRPSGSAAERAAVDAMRAWLDARGIAHREHAFRLRPYFFECAGAWLIASRALLALAAARGWGWRALPIALIGQAGGAADILGLPLVTWPGATRGSSLIMSFGPPAGRELLIAAHSDSKTELLDHRRRAVLLRGLRPGIALTLAAAILAALEDLLPLATERTERTERSRPFLSVSAVANPRRLVRALAVAAAIPVALLAWGLGLNLLLGRLARPSSGAVDNGAACAALLALAARLHSGAVDLRGARVTLAIFGGEEVNMQGSAAYLRERARAGTPPPAAMLNLELLGQRGPYVVWQRDGDALRSAPLSEEITALAAGAVEAVAGAAPRREPLINSDAFPFLRAGVPAAVLGTADPVYGTAGLHRPTDSHERVDLARLPEHVAVLEEVIRRFAADA